MGNTAGGGDEDTESVGTQTGIECCFEVSSLGADSGGQKPGSGGDAADFGEGFRIGGADDEAYGRRPAYGFCGYAQEKGAIFAMVLPVTGDQLLEGAGGGIGGVAEYEQSFVGVGGERGDAVFAQVGAEGDGVDVELFEAGSGVGGCGRADVAALGVEKHRDVRWNGGNGGAQEVHAGPAEGFVEGDVGLVAADEVGGGCDDGFVPRQQGVAVAFLRTN